MFSLTIECMASLCFGFQPVTSPFLYPSVEVCMAEGARAIEASPFPPGLYYVVCRPVPTVPDGEAVG